MPVDEVSLQIINMERAALDRWGRGDPDGFLEISAPDVAYFDPFLPERIDGLSALRKYYAELRGQIFIDSYEIVDPEVKVRGEIAILTYCFVPAAVATRCVGIQPRSTGTAPTAGASSIPIGRLPSPCLPVCRRELKSGFEVWFVPPLWG
jgi:hypothetical protein